MRVTGAEGYMTGLAACLRKEWAKGGVLRGGVGSRHACDFLVRGSGRTGLVHGRAVRLPHAPLF